MPHASLALHDLIWIFSSFFDCNRTVCGSSKCSTIAGVAMVRWFARFSSQKHDRPINASGAARLYVSRVQHDLHLRTEFREREIHEKAIRQVHHPLDQLCVIFKLVSCPLDQATTDCIDNNSPSFSQCYWAQHRNASSIWRWNWLAHRGCWKFWPIGNCGNVARYPDPLNSASWHMSSVNWTHGVAHSSTFD